MKLISKLILLLIPMLSLKTFAFPDFVRHGYTTCVTCHFSPSGGGLLTSYGKYIAGELLGAWNTSENALPWLVEPKEEPTFSAGVLSRGTQMYLDTPQVRDSSFKRMQLDLEAGLIRGPWYGFITGGLRGSSARQGQKDTDLKIRSYYLGHVEVTHAYRIGRFYPEYGLRHPNHNIPTRKGLYWNQGDEPYVAQASFYSPFMDYNIAYLSGAKETQLEGKYGGSASVIAKTANTRTGFSILDMSNRDARTYSRSLFTQIGYMDNGYTLVELASKFESQTNAKDAQKNLTFVESGWEVKKGFIPYIGYQRTHILNGNSTTTSTPIGLKIFPITHAEVNLEYQPIVSKNSAGTTKATYAFAMFNIYF